MAVNITEQRNQIVIVAHKLLIFAYNLACLHPFFFSSGPVLYLNCIDEFLLLNNIAFKVVQL